MAMDWKGCLFPLTLALSVLLFGSWLLAVLDRNPSLQTVLLGLLQVIGPDYAQAPPGTHTPLVS